jgi:hypothetical protein
VLTEATKRRIADACVTVRIMSGQFGEGLGRGVLVAGGFVFTAAHCVTHDLTGAMALGDHFLQEIETTYGVLRVTPRAVEPVADIAVFGAPDGQVFWNDASAFEVWCDAVVPVPLCREDFPMFQPVPVAVYTHRGIWLEGTIQQPRPDAHGVWITMPDGIEGGTSGSPIVTAQGAIVGIVSQVGGDASLDPEKGYEGFAPRPHLTLPVWVVQQIQAEEDSAGGC